MWEESLSGCLWNLGIEKSSDPDSQCGDLERNTSEFDLIKISFCLATAAQAKAKEKGLAYKLKHG